jgi:hypothetical protein
LRGAALGASLAAILTSLLPNASRAEFDWPLTLRLPDRDVAVGISGGVAFGEARDLHGVGGAGGVKVSLLHGLFGLHTSLRFHREGYSYRLSGGLEASFWYVVLVGAGAEVGGMLGKGGPGVPPLAAAMTVLIAFPVPVAKLGDGGSLWVVPYARPGMRFEGPEDVTGFHELGLMLEWTSFRL